MTHDPADAPSAEGDPEGEPATSDPWRRLRTRLFPRSGPWYRRWWLPLTGGALALVGVLALGGLFTYFYGRADIPPQGELVIPEPTAVYDAAGERVATLDPAAVRRNRDLGALPDHLKDAVLAAEDRQFYDHHGFSLKAIARALWDNITSGDELEGGSTITQQYVEIAIQDVPRTYLGKLREVAFATKLERHLSKDEIFERYLNGVPFGRGAIGVEAGARTYFGTSATDLTINEAATLAGIIPAPSRFDPAENPEAATRRRNYVLDGMVSKGWLDRSGARELKQAPLPDVNAEQPISFGPNAYFLDAVRSELEEQFGEGRDIYTGLDVHTTLDPRMQRLALENLRQHVGDTPYTGALVSVDPGTGAVFSLVGGLDYSRQRFNAATQARRQAGSSFKTFTLTSFVADGRSPEAVYRAPAEIELDTESGTYEVSNYENVGFGYADVREATLNSINTVYVQMQQDVGTEALVDTANELGIRSDLAAVPSLTLGTSGVSPLEMANAYASLASGGEVAQAHLVTRVTDRETGETRYTHESGGEQATEPNVAAVVSDILAENVERGTGTAAQIDRPAAGKTGTTQEYRDAWFVGYVPQVATAVWVGNLDNSPMERVPGGSIPAETWGDYMQAVLEGQDVMEFPEPDYSVLEAETTEPVRGDAGSPDADPTSSPSPAPSPMPSPDGDASPTPPPSPTTTPGGGSPSEDDGVLPDDGSPAPDDGSPSPEDSSSSSDGGSSPEQSSSPDSSPSPSPTRS